MPPPDRYLLQRIKDLGIDHPDLLEQVNSLTNLGLPYFTLIWPTEFPEGKLEMELHCQMDSTTGEWDLSDYRVAFTRPITFPAENIKGIDVLSLDRAMANVDWPVVTREFAIQRPYSSELIKQMNALKRAGPEGQLAYELLCIKHWYGTILYDPRLDEMKRNFVTEQQVEVKEPFEENLRYWYQQLSGRFDQYLAQLEIIGFPSSIYLKRMLVYSEGDFSLVNYKVMPDGIMKVDIPFKDKGGSYQVDQYQLNFYAIPPVVDGIYNGVDTALLHEEMKQIDWMDEESHYKQIDGGEYIFAEELDPIISQLQEILPADPKGLTVSAQLQLQFWSESPDFVGIIDEETWNYLDTLPCKKVEVPSGITAEQAYHLIKGQAVYLEDKDNFTGLWYHTHPGNNNEETLLLECDMGFSKVGLERRLQQLPCGRDQVSSALKQILNGENAEIILNNGQSIVITAAPILRELHMYNTEGKPLHPFLTSTMRQEIFQKPRLPNRRH